MQDFFNRNFVVYYFLDKLFPPFLFHMKHSILFNIYIFSDLFYFSKYILLVYLFIQIISREIFFSTVFVSRETFDYFLYLYFFRTYFISLNIYYLLTYLFKLFPGKYFFPPFLFHVKHFILFLYLYFFSDLFYFS